MLTKQHRYSFRNGAPRKSIQSPYYVLRYDSAEKFTYGIVVSKKIASRAVDRNRIKRLYKSILGELTKENTIFYSVVFYVRKKSLVVTKEELQFHIEQIFKKEGII